MTSVLTAPLPGGGSYSTGRFAQGEDFLTKSSPQLLDPAGRTMCGTDSCRDLSCAYAQQHIFPLVIGYASLAMSSGAVKSSSAGNSSPSGK